MFEKDQEYILLLKEKLNKYWPVKGPGFPYGIVPTVKYLSKRAKDMPEKIALNYYGRELTYKELDELSNKLANFLIARGYKKGDFIGIYMLNCPQWAISYWGIVKMGGVAVTLNPMFKAHELNTQITDSGVKAIIALDQLYPAIEGLRDEKNIKEVIVTGFKDFLPDKPSLPLLDIHKIPPKKYSGTVDFMEALDIGGARAPEVKLDLEDAAYICYTGGTTGYPKGCVHTHKSVLAAAALQSMGWRADENSVGLILTPMFLITTKSIVCDFLPYSGGTVILLNRWDPVTFMMAVDKYHCDWTWTARVDAQVEVMNHPDVSKYNLSSLRKSFSSPFGMALTEEIREKWSRLTKGGILCDLGYGMTENHATGALSLGLQDYDLKEREGVFVGLTYAPLGVMGELVIKVVDPVTKEIQPFGVPGEIVQKSPALCRGYLNKPEETRLAFDEDGWLYTGDVGVIDENGFLTIKGRVKDLIKVSGMSVFPKEIEDTLTGLHPGIEVAGVIGVPDDRTGEAPLAFVKLRAEYRGKLTEEDVIGWCRENMSKIKVPRKVFILDEIPLNPLGKVAKEELKKWWGSISDEFKR